MSSLLTLVCFAQLLCAYSLCLILKEMKIGKKSALKMFVILTAGDNLSNLFMAKVSKGFLDAFLLC